MGRPVDFDDGGSIRIRRFEENGPGELDGLLNKPPEHAVDPTDDYSKALITWAKSDGTWKQENFAFNTLTLFNDLNDITVEVRLAGKKLHIKIPPGKVPAQVRKDVHPGNKFSYTISNAGRINKYKVDGGPEMGPFTYLNLMIV